MPTPVGFDPATYNQSSSGGFNLGSVYEYNGRLFQFIQNAADAALADGDVCEVASATTYKVTGATLATSLGDIPAGVAVGAIAVNNYGFILIRGLHTNVKGVATITVGKTQKCSATAGSGFDIANLYDATFGVALTALSAGRYTVLVKI